MQFRARRCAQTAVWIAAMTCSMARAEMSWDFSGFASLGAGKVNRDDLTFMDYNGDWSFDSDSMLALQGILGLTSRFSMTGQVVSRGYNVDDNVEPYAPEIEWFFASYDLNPDTRLRFGRLRTPHYLFSESLEIGYSYPWARPPVDVYVFFLEPFSHFDGADISYQTTVGDGFETELKAFGGRMSGTFMGIDIEVSRTVGAVVSTKKDDLTLRYGINTNRTDLHLPGGQVAIDGFDTAASFWPTTFGGMSENFYDNNQEYRYHGAGLQWEPGAWNITAEKFLFLGPKEQYSLDSRGYYISVGRQYGDWMPYGVIGEYRTRIDKRIVQQIKATYDVVPENLSEATKPLDDLRQGAIAALLQRDIGQRTQTLGLRWDFRKDADLKLEFQYFTFLSNSTGHMLPDDDTNKPPHAIATAIIMDVVF